MSRRDEKGQMMDQLAYSYYQDDNNLPTNKLQAIQENASDRADYEKEIKQAVNAEDSLFVYDEIGQLIEDRGDKTQYTWNVYNKLSQVRSNPGQGSLEINYTYDAAGNRVRKEVIRNACDTLNTFYVRDAQGNIMAVYQQETGEQKAQTKEIPIYGSDRLGMYLPNSESFVSLPSDSGMASRLIGHRRYELKDHLGNVRVVLSDQKRLFKVDYLSDTTLSLQLRASVLSYNNYYPFGLEQPEATLNSENYRFGFNGKENDREWGTGGLTQDYGFRLYNPGIAKFLSVDPLTGNYPFYSPYQFAGNSPITNIDLDGLEKIRYVMNSRVRGYTLLRIFDIEDLSREAQFEYALQFVKQHIGKSFESQDFNYLDSRRPNDYIFNRVAYAEMELSRYPVTEIWVMVDISPTESRLALIASRDDRVTIHYPEIKHRRVKTIVGFDPRDIEDLANLLLPGKGKKAAVKKMFKAWSHSGDDNVNDLVESIFSAPNMDTFSGRDAVPNSAHPLGGTADNGMRMYAPVKGYHLYKQIYDLNGNRLKDGKYYYPFTIQITEINGVQPLKEFVREVPLRKSEDAWPYRIKEKNKGYYRESRSVDLKIKE